MTLVLTTPYRRIRRPAMAEFTRTESRVRFPIDVQADPDGFTIYAVLPGIDPDELDIQILDDAITLQGDFKAESDEQARFLLRERATGKFQRTVHLPVSLNPEQAEAELRNGVLKLRVPKAETAKPKSIKVQAN
jgi:HSP20 family protein